MSPPDENTVEAARELVRRWRFAPEMDRDLADFEAAIRKDERAKWDAVKQGYVDATATIENEFRAFRENLETFIDERSKAQPDSALRAAAREALHWLNEAFERRPMHGAIAAADRLQAALDGAPYEPSVEEVERALRNAVEEYGKSLYEDDYYSQLKRETSFEDGWRAALKAVFDA